MCVCVSTSSCGIFNNLHSVSYRFESVGFHCSGASFVSRWMFWVSNHTSITCQFNTSWWRHVFKLVTKKVSERIRVDCEAICEVQTRVNYYYQVSAPVSFLTYSLNLIFQKNKLWWENLCLLLSQLYKAAAISDKEAIWFFFNTYNFVLLNSRDLNTLKLLNPLLKMKAPEAVHSASEIVRHLNNSLQFSW